MNKGAGTNNSKKGDVWIEKKIWKSLLGKKYLLGKPVPFSVKYTVNNADTWRFIQQFFQYLYRTTNSIVHGLSLDRTNSQILATAHFARKNTAQQSSSGTPYR